jgi:hypothetical protein
VATGTAAEVEKRLAIAQIEPLEVDGQHARAPACSSRTAR